MAAKSGMGNRTVISAGYVDPNRASNIQLGDGVYSLNRRCNVPFVSLVGSLGFRKTISWGETAEVPCGELVTVHNASYHGGDVFLNKGHDTDNTPGRITVPVRFVQEMVTVSEGESLALKTSFPCDVRGATRAYLNIDANVAAESGLAVYIRGRRLDGSMHTYNSLATYPKPFGPGIGYLNASSFAFGTELSYIPLGQGASETDDTRPHCLLDSADVFLLLGDESDPVSDYLDWPADGGLIPGVEPAPTELPGAWYIIEYA